MKKVSAALTVTKEPPNDIVYPSTIPFLLVHLACFAMIWTGATMVDWIMCFGFLAFRMWSITAGYHRYFSHRSFKTGRIFQFFLAFASQSSAQRGVLWWSAVHRQHHRYSDTPEDAHSPVHHGFWFAHVGWIFSRSKSEPDYSTVKDLRRFPELVWLDRHRYLPAILLAVIAGVVGGWSGLIVGFALSTVFLYHTTFAINSLAHVVGRRRYPTGDESRNNWWLALLTMGEGWHNNHHYYQSSTRQGFHWYEVDMTFYVLKFLSFFGIVWDLRSPPAYVLRGEKRLSAPVIEQVAYELAGTFSPERITNQVREAWAGAPTLEDLSRQAQSQALAYLETIHLPQLPSLEEIRSRAQETFALTPSLDEIATRTREILLETVSSQLLEQPA